MKLLFWFGLVVVVLGLVSLVVPIPQTQREGISAGGMSVEVETRHSERVSPIVSGVLILAGAGMMVGARRAPRA